MRLVHFLNILWLIPALAWAQTPQKQIDSLQLQLKNERNDTLRVNILNQITRTSASIDLKKATAYAQQALSEAKKAKWIKGIATSEKYLGNVLMESGQREEALIHFVKAYGLFIKIGDKEGQITALYNLGNIHQHANQYADALEYFIKGIRLAEAIKNNSLQAKGSYLVSSIFVQQYNFEKARAYAESAASNFKKEKNYTEIANSLEIVGVSYLLEKKTEKAKVAFYEALKYLDTVGNDFGKAKIYTQLVECLSGEPALQLDFIDKSLEIWKKSDFNSIYAISNIGNRGIIFIDLYQNDSLRKKMPDTFSMTKAEMLAAADSNLREGITLAKASGNSEQLMQFYRAYYRVLEEKGQYRKSIEILNNSYKISDSLYSQNNKNKIAAIESTYEIELRDNEIKLNKLKLDSQKKQQIYMLGGLSLLFIIGSLLFYQSRTRRKNNKKLLLLNQQLDESNKVKARFFGILNHDLRSPVANLIHFLHLKKENPELLSEENKTRLEQKTITAAENLLISMEDILLWSKGQMENFKPNFKKIEVSELFNDLSKHFGSEENVEIRFENSQQISVHTDENYLKTIMRNLTGNAIKALTATENPKIVWNATEENKKVQLSISDNGPGGSNEKFRALYDDSEVVGIKTGLGLHLIRDLARTINCEIDLVSQAGKGTTIILKFS